jgi:hypothetical protein
MLSRSCIKYSLFFDHSIHRTIFQITGNETTLVLRVISNKIAIFQFLLCFCRLNITNLSIVIHPDASRCFFSHT